MGPLDGLQYGLHVALTPENVLIAVGGAFLGTAVGILPGLSPTIVIAILLIPTMHLPAETALIAMGAIYYGTQYGDSLSAVLMGIPSEPPSVVVGIDGFQLARKGRAGAALSVAGVSAFVGATIGLVGLTLLAGPAAAWALAFAPPEYFVLTIVGFLLLTRLSSSSFTKAMVGLALGLAMVTVGLDPIVGLPRFTFGQIALYNGIELVPAVMGLIGMAEVLYMASEALRLPRPPDVVFRELWPTWKEWRRSIPASLRGSVVGFIFGLAPGPSTTLGTFASYRLEQRLNPKEVGHGALEAVAGPKAADDASVSSHLVPLLSLGLPWTTVTALLYATMLLHGITPGPLLIREHPEIFWGLVAAMYIGNLALLVLNFPFVALWTKILRIPQWMLAGTLVLLMLIGAYALRNSMFDVFVVVCSGVLGFVMRQCGYDRMLVILGMALGPVFETSFSQSLAMSSNSPLIFFTRPIPQVLWVLLLIVYVAPPLYRRLARNAPLPVAPAPAETAESDVVE